MLSLLTRLYPLTETVYSRTIFTHWEALQSCHYRGCVNNHVANLVHMPGTPFDTRWPISTNAQSWAQTGNP